MLSELTMTNIGSPGRSKQCKVMHTSNFKMQIAKFRYGVRP
jgi:hypothetical protein